MTTTTIIRKKGQFTLPVNIREQLGVEENDVLTITVLDKKAMLIVPQKLKSAEVLKKTAMIAKKKGISLEEMLNELEEIRHKA